MLFFTTHCLILFPIEPAGPEGGVIPMQPLPARLVSPAASVPAQAIAHGGTFVRPGALAWGGTRAAPEGAYSSCELVEQALAAAVKDPDRVDDFLSELARARLWVPLPADGPVAEVPLQAPFPIDITFPGESEPDLVDNWISRNTKPFYTRD